MPKCPSCKLNDTELVLMSETLFWCPVEKEFFLLLEGKIESYLVKTRTTSLIIRPGQASEV